MGNVMASSERVSSAVPAGFPDSLKPPPPLAEPQISDSGTKLDRDNPGTVEDISKKCKDVVPMTFEGAKVMLNKGLSNHFQVSHTLNLCSNGPSGYRFGATYVGTTQFSPNEAFPVLLGDIDPSGNLNANIIHQFTPRIRCKFAAQIQQQRMNLAQLTTDYKGDDYTASLTIGNPNLLTNSGVTIFHFLQSLTKNLAIGAELAYQFGPSVPGGKVAVASAVGRYINGNATWSGIIGGSGINLCYHHKASEQLQICASLETNLRMQESVGTIGYQVDMPKADLVFKGMLDSNWNVGAVMEKRLQPLPFTFALSGRLNHTKNQFRLGCGLVIG